MAVAISADPKITSRPDQDSCIAAYHFMLAAWTYALGTCWIGGMNRAAVKDRLGLPQEHYLATVTPLGYPDERPEPRPRREVEAIVRLVEPTG
jgi:nitroreductase